MPRICTTSSTTRQVPGAFIYGLKALGLHANLKTWLWNISLLHSVAELVVEYNERFTISPLRSTGFPSSFCQILKSKLHLKLFSSTAVLGIGAWTSGEEFHVGILLVQRLHHNYDPQGLTGQGGLCWARNVGQGCLSLSLFGSNEIARKPCVNIEVNIYEETCIYIYNIYIYINKL